MPIEPPTAETMFREAERCYRQLHQACMACSKEHCVFFTVWEGLSEYRCFECGFGVGHDGRRGEYIAFSESVAGSDLFCDEEPTLLDNLEDHPALRGDSRISR